MTREIKFRGKRKDNGEWVYGDLIHTSPTDMSIVECGYFTVKSSYEVIPETVGQSTGLKDKNGKKIFEGDVCRVLYTDWASQTDYSISLEEYLISISNIGYIVWNAPKYEIKFNKGGFNNLDVGTNGCKEVIGNIYENPELLDKKT